MAKLSQREIKRLRNLAKDIRKEILEMIYRTKSPHIGPSFSMVELLVGLYFKCLKINPNRPQEKARDRFILSKGHACPALYATLAHRGFFSKTYLKGFAINGGTLEHHSNRDVKRGIEASTGSLGHGLPMSVGMALAEKYDKSKHGVFVLLADGETNEGSVWEAIMFAAHHKLDNLIAIVDYNKIQALGRTKDIINLEPYAEKWRSFGWGVREIDGHNFSEILNAMGNIPFRKKKPSVIIAHTIKGKGVSFMEDKLLWHYRCPDEEEYKKALKELE